MARVPLDELQPWETKTRQSEVLFQQIKADDSIVRNTNAPDPFAFVPATRTEVEADPVQRIETGFLKQSGDIRPFAFLHEPARGIIRPDAPVLFACRVAIINLPYPRLFPQVGIARGRRRIGRSKNHG